MNSIARFARLSYTSSDTVPETAPGWGVKEVDAVSVSEAAEIAARMPQLVAWAQEVPQTAGLAEKDALPRRLSQHVLPGIGSCLFHTTPAGTDDSGRPGNTYTQAVLDRSPGSAGDQFRPTDAWRSPDWAIPFSKFEVGAARLGPWQRPEPGPVSGADAVVRFILDAEYPLRAFVLPCVLDAVLAALAGGPGVVLGVDDTDEAAGWLAAVLGQLAPSTARTVGFSTFERAASLPAAIEAGLRVMCVPRTDLGMVDAALAVVVIDAHGEQQLDANRTAHLLRRGARVPVTDFSRVVAAVLDDEAGAVRVLARLDDQAAPRVDLPADLPVALAFLDYTGELADGGDEFADARAAAARIVIRSGSQVSPQAAHRAARILLADPEALRDAYRPATVAAGDPSLLADDRVQSAAYAILARVRRGDRIASADLLRFLDLAATLGAVPPPPGWALPAANVHPAGDAVATADHLLHGLELVVDALLRPGEDAAALRQVVGPLGPQTRGHLAFVVQARVESLRSVGRWPGNERNDATLLDWARADSAPDPAPSPDGAQCQTLDLSETIVELARLVSGTAWDTDAVSPRLRMAVQAAWLVAVVSGNEDPPPPGVVHIPDGDPSLVWQTVRRSTGEEALAAAAFLAGGDPAPTHPVPASVAALASLTAGGSPVLAEYGHGGDRPGLDETAVLTHVHRLLGGDPGPDFGDRLHDWLHAACPNPAPRQGDHS